MPNTKSENEKTISLNAFMDVTAKVVVEEMDELIKHDPSLLLTLTVYSALIAEKIFKENTK